MLHKEEERVELVRMREKEEVLAESVRRESEQTERKLKIMEEKAREAVETADEAEKRRVEEESRTVATIQQAAEANKFGVQDLAPTRRKIDPEQVANAYRDAAKAYLESVSLKTVANDHLYVFIGYCRGRLQAANEKISEEQIPSEVLEAATHAFAELKRYVDQVEDLFRRNICLPPGQFKQRVSPRSLPPLNHLSEEYRDICASRLTEFAAEYERRNALIVRQEEEVMRAMIFIAGTYFEEEALESIGNSYFEVTPLTDLLKSIEDDTRQNFLNACGLKVDSWKRKYSEFLNEEIQSRRSRIQEKNEQKQMKTQLEIAGIVEEAVRNYAKKLSEELTQRVPWKTPLLKHFHDETNKKLMKDINAVFLQKYRACPVLHDIAVKEFKSRVEVIVNQRPCINLAWPQHFNPDAQKARANLAKTAGDTNIIVGIHLGNRNSSMAIYRCGEVQLIKDRGGRESIPSCVFFPAADPPVAGHEAKAQAYLNPQDTIYDLMKLIGRDISDPNVQINLPNWDFEVIARIDGKARIRVHGELLRPDEILSYVIQHLVQIAEEDLQLKIVEAVISVPASFNDSQRTATLQAALHAGLKVLEIISDPTAAVMAYGWYNWSAVQKTFLVFDFGAESLSVSILKTDEIDATVFYGFSRTRRASNDPFRVVATMEDVEVGGDKLDEILVQHCVDEFKKKHGIDLLVPDSVNTRYAVNRRRLRLRTECIRAKHILSTVQKTTIKVDCIYGNEDLCVDFTRQEFEQMCEPLFQRAVSVVQSLLREAALTAENVDEVLMIGGSSRIPRVKYLIESLMRSKPINRNDFEKIEDPIATGAAIQAYLRGGRSITPQPQ